MLSVLQIEERRSRMSDIKDNDLREIAGPAVVRSHLNLRELEKGLWQHAARFRTDNQMAKMESSLTDTFLAQMESVRRVTRFGIKLKWSWFATDKVLAEMETISHISSRR